GQDQLADQFARSGTDDAGTDDLFRFGVDDQLRHAVDAVQRDSAAGSTPREADHVYIPVLLLRFRFRKSCPSELGIGEHDRRNHLGLEGYVLAGDDLRRDDAFVRGFVREHGTGGDVSDSEDVGIVGPALRVDLNEASLVHLYLRVLEAQIGRVGPATDGHEDAVEKLFGLFDFVALKPHTHLFTLDCHLGDPGAE